MLINLAASADLFHTATGTAYADLVIDGHRETWPVRSPRFSGGLRRAEALLDLVGLQTFRDVAATEKHFVGLEFEQKIVTNDCFWLTTGPLLVGQCSVQPIGEHLVGVLAGHAWRAVHRCRSA